MENYITQLRKSFSGKTDEEFAAYVYHTLQKEIDATYKIGNHKLKVSTVNLGEKWSHIHDRLLDIIKTNSNNVYSA